MPDTHEHIAEQALEQLVHQFARPMDFIRELVQNSIDAGTPRIEIWVDWSEPEGTATQGVLQIHVDDFGEGMDESIIDSQLTRMFSSTKENDLTKIGKFGIGFTSIFAMNPSAVVVHTGRHGESWEIFFHADRSFDKVRLDRPVRGTQITLFKELHPAHVDSTISELREVLVYWCEHSSVPIQFSGSGPLQQPEAAQGSDPWAGFDAPAEITSAAETIARPMDLDTDIKVRLEQDGVEVIVGYLEDASHSFFNGGITLVRTTATGTIDYPGPPLHHLSFKVKYRMLEHTLTRDNVIQDAAWAKTLEVVQEASRLLPSMLVDHVEQRVADPKQLAGQWQQHLAEELEHRPELCSGLVEHRALLAGLDGTPIRTSDMLKQGRQWDGILTRSRLPELNERLQAHGLHLLDPSLTTERLALALAAQRYSLLDKALATLQRVQNMLDMVPSQLQVVQSARHMIAPKQVPQADLLAIELELLEAASFFLSKPKDLRAEVVLVSMGAQSAHTATTFACIGDPEASVQRLQQSVSTLQRWELLQATFLVNRDDPLWPDLLRMAEHRPAAARMLLCQSIADDCKLPHAYDQMAIDINPLEFLK
jgi:hypothetical protein